jgi:DNA polymerase-1
MDKFLKKMFDTLREDPSVMKPKLNDRVLLVDFLNTFIRSFTGSPAMNNNGEHCGGITGFLYSLGMGIRTCNATRVIIISDGENSSSHRKKIYPEYKEKRQMKVNLNRAYDFKTPDEEKRAMTTQMLKLIEYLQYLPIQFIAMNNTEADDTISYVAKTYLPETSKVCIMSSDKDFLQLVDDRTTVWSPTKKKLYNRTSVFDEYGIYPENFLHARSFLGDTSDNIGGVDGIGLKTLKKCVPMLTEDRQVNSSEILMHVEQQNIERKGKLKAYVNILNSKELLLLNEKLMNLKEPMIGNTEQLKVHEQLNKKIHSLQKMDLLLMHIKDGINNSIDINKWLLENFTQINNIVSEKISFIGE